MLAGLRGMWPQMEEGFDSGEVQHAVRAMLGVHGADQIEAASAETLMMMAKHEGEGEKVLARRGDVAPMMIAAVMRCVARHHCEHALDGKRPLVAFLAARVIACERCLLKYERVLAEHDVQVRAGGDLLCDFCLEDQEDGYFRPTIVPYGPARLFGDMCDACYALTEKP